QRADEVDLLDVAHVLLHGHDLLQRGVVALLQLAVDVIDTFVYGAAVAHRCRIILQGDGAGLDRTGGVIGGDGDGLVAVAVGQGGVRNGSGVGGAVGVQRGVVGHVDGIAGEGDPGNAEADIGIGTAGVDAEERSVLRSDGDLGTA